MSGEGGSWKRYLSSKWLMLAAGIWIQSTSGSSYTFGIYSEAIKTNLNYDQSTLDTISSCKDIGANVGILSGILYGIGAPWMVLLAGALQNFVGYAYLWLAVTRRISGHGVWEMGFFMFVAAHAQTFFNTAVAVTAVENFPSDRGTVVGIMKGFLGLSGAILLQIYYTIYEGNQTSYLLMLSWLPSVSSILLMFIIKVHPSMDTDTNKTLNRLSLMSVATAGYLMVVILLEHMYRLSHGVYVIISIGLISILVCPFLISIKKTIDSHRSMSITQPLLDHEIDLKCSLNEREVPNKIMLEDQTKSAIPNSNIPQTYSPSRSITSEEQQGSFENAGDVKSSVVAGEDSTPLQALRTWDFWFLFIAMACGMGSGLATINNMSQIGLSLGYKSTETNTLISLWSIWNFTGRFGAGYISELFLHSKGCPRPLFIAIALLIMSTGHLVIASGLPGSLYVGSILVGVCYGCQWSLMPATTSEIFGLPHFGTLFNAIAIASPIGSYFLSVKVIGHIYDTQAQKQQNMHSTMLVLSTSQKACHGVQCFRLSFCIMSAVCLLGCVIALVLFQKTRAFYKEVIFRRIMQRNLIS